MDKKITNIGYDKEFLIQYFWDFYNKYGYFLSGKELKGNPNIISEAPYKRYWGSFNNFLKEINVMGENGWYKYDENILKTMYPTESKEIIISSLMKKRTWERIIQKASIMNLSRNIDAIYGSSYNKDDLKQLFWDYFKKYNIFPTSKDFESEYEYRVKTDRDKLYESWNDFLIDLDVIGNDGWYKCDEKVLTDMYETEPEEDIIEKLMIKRKWNRVKQKASKMGLRRDSSFIRKIYSDEYLISELHRYYNAYNKTPRYNDFKDDNGFPSGTIYRKRFESWNNALTMAGFELNTNFNHDKQEIMNFVKEFYKVNKRSPNYNEVPYSRTVINDYWNKWSNCIIECGLSLNRKPRNDHYKSDEELLRDYKDLYLNIGRIPIAKDVNLRENMASFSTYMHRFESYENIWNLCKIDHNDIINSDSIYSFICLDKNGERCNSYAEMVITNLLIDNNINYTKEYLYKNIIKNINTKMKMDWYLNDFGICVEFFGLYRDSKLNDNDHIGIYSRKTKRKIKLCKDNNIQLIDLYNEDLNQVNLERMIGKFDKFNIKLKMNNEKASSYKNKVKF